MNHENLKPCHWKRSPLQFLSWEGPRGETGAGRHRAPAPGLAPPSVVVQKSADAAGVSLSYAQLFIPPAKTTCLLMTNHWDSFLWPQLAWATQACACHLVPCSPVALRWALTSKRITASWSCICGNRSSQTLKAVINDQSVSCLWYLPFIQVLCTRILQWLLFFLILFIYFWLCWVFGSCEGFL